MTEEERQQLLLKDLCARLPYGVKFEFTRDNVRIAKGIDLRVTDEGKWEYFVTSKGASAVEITEIKPYLRSMSSMTEEERREFSIFTGKTEVYIQQIRLDADSMANPIIGGNKCVYWGLFDRCIDWLNAHHFDYRGLIKKGLALEAPEGMYKTK